MYTVCWEDSKGDNFYRLANAEEVKSLLQRLRDQGISMGDVLVFNPNEGRDGTGFLANL
jgi:hypothetical protein